MLIDTHCHLDAPEFDADRAAVIKRAVAAGVAGWVIPSVARPRFDTVRRLAHARYPGATAGGFYALGIHPLFVPQATDDDLQVLAQCVIAAQNDPRFVGIGEIGLDFFVPVLCTPAMRARQEQFYAAQLALAQRHGLPVILHVRRSQDVLLKYLRRVGGPAQRRTGALTGGIVHAFNGSFQQAQQFIDLGFALGLGGAMTYARARQIRRLAAQLPDHAWVLETDAPDLTPQWLARPDHAPARNEPAELPRIAQVLADLRQTTPAQIIAQHGRNACRVLPRLSLQ